MNKDVHILSESYKTIREQQFAKFGTSQSPQTPKPGLASFVHTQQGVTPSLTKMSNAMQSVNSGMDNMKADRLMDELMQDMKIDPKYKGELIKLAISLAQKSAAEKK